MNLEPNKQTILGMPTLYLHSTATSFPAQELDNSSFSGLSDSNHKMFKGTERRYHLPKSENSVTMIRDALLKLEKEQNIILKEEVDAILTNVSLPDLPFTGVGAMVAKELNLTPKVILDVHNTGCISFLFMMEMARSLMISHQVKKILICVAQTAAGRVFSQKGVIERMESVIPGDGVGVALFTNEGTVSMVDVLIKNHPEFSYDMGITSLGKERFWWETGDAPLTINFDEDKVSSIIMRGNKLVPEAMHEILKRNGIKSSELLGLITNQPNTYFLRNWRESVQIPEERHFHTFSKYANLFQSGIPVNLDYALKSSALKGKKGYLILAGFSHAGDYSGAALLKIT